MTLVDLKIGDRAYVLNGRQNNLFSVVVSDRDGNAVQVYIESKDDHQWFWDDNGEADAIEGDAELVSADDWRVAVLNTRKIFKNHHVAVQKAQTEFRKDPTTARANVLMNVTEHWTLFTKTADPFAIRAESIEEYKLITKQI